MPYTNLRVEKLKTRIRSFKRSLPNNLVASVPIHWMALNKVIYGCYLPTIASR